MQSLQTTNIAQDLVGVKRQPSVIFDFAGFEDICKKVKPDTQVKLEDSNSTQPSPTVFIPSFRPPSSPATSPNINLEVLKSLMLLNQSTIMQRYLHLLTLNQYAQHQQKTSLLIPSREDSSTSCSSYSSCNSSVPIRVPIVIKKPDVQNVEIPKFEEVSLHKKSLKASACKNYIALLCTGFARSLLTAKASGELMNHMFAVIAEKKVKYAEISEKKDEELKDSVLEHIYKDICGKKVKKMNKGRDFKVRNSEELGELLTIKEEDGDIAKFRKEILKEMLDYFFTSTCYLEWLEKGMITQANRDFFMKNKVEIQKKFKNPILYKPHFDY